MRFFSRENNFYKYEKNCLQFTVDDPVSLFYHIHNSHKKGNANDRKKLLFYLFLNSKTNQ